MRLFSTLLLFATIAACSNGSTGPAPTSDFTATIDGTSWASTQTQVTGPGAGSNQVPGSITITGTQIVSATNYTTVMLSLGYIAGPGTYPLGVNAGTTAGGMGTVTAIQGVSLPTWSTNFTGAAGTVTVTELSATRIKGTFQFTAPPQSYSQGTTGTRTVTNGAFDVALPVGFTPAPSNNRGSKISALVNGASWNGATVTALGSQTVFVVGGTTDSLSVTMSPATVLAQGQTYLIGGTQSGVQNGTMIVTRLPSGASWNSGTGTAVGSMTITSLGNGRAAGTFNANLVSATGGGGGLSITQGTFDVKILIQP